MSLTMPQVSVQLSLTGPPFFGEATNFVDISRYVKSFSTTIGRQHELDRFEPGTIKLTLDNTDGRFSPWTTVYHGYGIGNPVHITATWAANTYDVAYAYITCITPKWTSESFGEVIIECQDALEMLGTLLMTGCLYDYTVLTTNAAANYFPLADLPGSTTAANQVYPGGIQGQPLTVNGTVAFGQSGPSFATIGTSAAFDTVTNTENDLHDAGGNLAVTGTSYSVEVWINPSAWPASESYVYAQRANATDSNIPQVGIGINSNGEAFAVISDGAGTVFATATSAPWLNLNEWNQLTLIRDTTNLFIFVNGVNEAGATLTSNYVTPTPAVTLVGQFTQGSGYINFDGDICRVSNYSYGLSTTQVSDDWEIGVNGFVNGELSGTRINNVLNLINWSPTMRSIMGGQSQCQSPVGSLAQTQVISYIQSVEDTEAGYFFQAPNGNMTFYDRSYPVNSERGEYSQQTYSNNGTGLAYLGASLTCSLDKLDLYNDVQGQRITGPLRSAAVLQHVWNLGSIETYGTGSIQNSNMLQMSDQEVANQCNWFLGQYQTPQFRIRSISFDNTIGAGANLTDMLTRQIMDAVTVIIEPLDGSGQTFSQLLCIEGIDHSVTPDTWKTTLHLSKKITSSYAA